MGAVGVTWLDGAAAGPVPTPFVAATVKVYAVPSVRPVMVALVAGGLPRDHGRRLADSTRCNGVTVYEVIGLPPLAGAVQVTLADLSPAVAETPVGAPGAVGGAWLPGFEYHGGHLPDGPGAGADAGRRGGTRGNHLVFGEEFHVAGAGDVGPGGVAGPSGQAVAEPRVGVEPDGQLIAGAGGRRRAGRHRGRRARGPGCTGLLVDRGGAGRGREPAVFQGSDRAVSGRGELGGDRRGRSRARGDRCGPDALLGLVRAGEMAHLGEGVAGRVGHAAGRRLGRVPDADLYHEPIAAAQLGRGGYGDARCPARRAC